LGSLQRSPRALAIFRGPASKRTGGERKGRGEERDRRREEEGREWSGEEGGVKGEEEGSSSFTLGRKRKVGAYVSLLVLQQIV